MAARLAIIAGGAGSLALMLFAGRNSPLVLQLLFAIWVPAPFIAGWFAHIGSWTWPEEMRLLVYFLIIVICIAALAVYAFAAFGPLRGRPAPFFVAVPVILWLLLGVSFVVSGGQPRR